MSAYIIVDISIHDPATYERYKELAPASIEQYGGRYVARGGATETLEGSWQPNRIVILEFPDADAARRWWASDEYAEAKRLRQSASNADMLLVQGL